ncbi:pimeloyl-ACP methyl ester carboxylesterase [Kribbella amoyensis]|uniref:Pimeloyl-ACP methyl ester carboxylesterase n=1 Tax=Kribbella amoyensis TaxID=996641 RepID=A0A561BS75_9ACTN|nr:alpha/beta hydrolase [Kribbella amoyensis]TWD81747.1 pimeloyl-ACP methyl ester carboxylesterase [Kribbella amoyensis]
MPESLVVPGAVLHYQVRGTGPVLLIAQSGEGDADRSTDLVAQLTDAYTVVTYDRRGLSRSRLADPGRGVTLAEHTDDAHRVLAAVTDAPALMLGCSLGAVIGLRLARLHPEQLSTLIAHEPIAPGLLAEGTRIRHRQELADLRARYLRDGLAATVPEIARTLGIDPTHADAEPDLTPQPMTERRLGNFDHFLRHDFPAVLADDFDYTDLATSGLRIVPAAGRSTPATVFDRQCAVALAELVGHPVVEFPGGHNGNTSHPKAYAERLREALATSP